MLNLYSIPNFIVGTLFLLLGAFVFSKNPKRLVNRIFAGICAVSMIWQLFYAATYNLKSDVLAYLLFKFSYTGIIFISPFFSHYIFIVLKLEKKFKSYIRWCYIIGISFALFIPTTSLFLEGVYRYFWGFYPKRGIIHPFFLIYFIGNLNVAVSVTAYYLFFKRKELNALQVNQIKLLLIGFSVYTIACVDFIPNYGIEIYPFGYACALFFISIISFTIIRYKLFEIDTVIHKTLLWILTSCFVLIPIGGLLYFTRPWFQSLGLLSLTLVVTGLFYLFLYYFRTIQPKIDHLFRRKKYDYYQALAQIPQHIGSELDIKAVINRLFKELKEVLYIRNAIILIEEPGNLTYTPIYKEAGSIISNALINKEKKEPVVIAKDTLLISWLSLHKKALEREQVEVDPQFDTIKQEALSLFKTNCLEAVIPIVMEDKVNAILGIGKKESLAAFTLKDIELLEHICKQIGITIDNALHHEDIVEKERLAEELRLGREIQMNLLPQEVPQIADFAISGLMLPAKEIGGDYYDFITLPKEGELAIVIGDVSGKGVAAGLLMAMAKTAIHTLSQEDRTPKQVLLRTNSILYQHIGGQKFMTMLYFKYKAEDRSLHYSSAGHEHILVYRSNIKEVESITSGGFMLGMLQDIDTYLEDSLISLLPHDKVLLYTDGVTEAENTQGERFGLERLKGSFKTNSSKSPEELIQTIKTEVYEFIGTQPQYDDITLVGMEAQ